MLMMGDERSYYDLLELTPDASPQEVRAAYLRAKAAYKKDSVALYTLISEQETEDLLRKIEEAYQVLSNPERRRQYDRSHGLLMADEESMMRPAPPMGRKIVSIDRVPPMEDMRGEMDILVAPSTDFGAAPRSSSAPAASTGGGIFDEAPAAPAQRAVESPFADPVPQPSMLPNRSRQASLRHPTDQFNDQAIAQEIESEQEWRGPFLRKVREARSVPIEELSDFTKISKTYLLAIEEENYSRLPAPVYLRGFITQVAKYLKLPHDKVANAYLARFNDAKAEKEKVKMR